MGIIIFIVGILISICGLIIVKKIHQKNIYLNEKLQKDFNEQKVEANLKTNFINKKNAMSIIDFFDRKTSIIVTLSIIILLLLFREPLINVIGFSESSKEIIIKELQKSLEGERQVADSYKSDVDKADAKYQNLREQYNEVFERYKSSDSRNIELEQQLKNLEFEIEKQKEVLEAYKSRYEESQNQIRGLTDKLAASEDKESLSQMAIDSLRSALNQIIHANDSIVARQAVESKLFGTKLIAERINETSIRVYYELKGINALRGTKWVIADSTATLKLKVYDLEMKDYIYHLEKNISDKRDYVTCYVNVGRVGDIKGSSVSFVNTQDRPFSKRKFIRLELYLVEFEEKPLIVASQDLRLNERVPPM